MDMNAEFSFYNITTWLLYFIPALLTMILFYAHIKNKYGFVTYGDVISVSVIAVVPVLNIAISGAFLIEMIASCEWIAFKKFLNKKAF